MDNIENKEKYLWFALEYLELAQIGLELKDKVAGQEEFIEMCLERAKNYNLKSKI